MLEPNKNAHLLSDLLKKVDEKKPEKETLAQVNSSFCLNKNKNKIAEFTQSLNAMRTKLSGLAERSFVAPLLRMTDGGEVAHTAQPKSVGEAVFAKPRRNVAFTLAEVLITLGIIGIVAAMTIPSLMSRYKTFVLQQQFKKVYAALSVAVQKTQFDLGENVRCHYGKGNSNSAEHLKEAEDCDIFYNELAKQLNVIESCDGNKQNVNCIPEGMYRSYNEIHAEYNNLEGEEASELLGATCSGFASVNDRKRKVYKLQGGFWLSPYRTGDYPLFMVDINGNKGPNKWGYDVFTFYFSLPDRVLYNHYFTINPDNCMLVEKGGFTTSEFMNRVLRGTADF